MNSTLFFVVCIVAIVMCANVVQTWLKQRNKKTELDEDFEETLAKINVLEERVRVLERIITENRFDLKKEIENL